MACFHNLKVCPKNKINNQQQQEEKNVQNNINDVGSKRTPIMNELTEKWKEKKIGFNQLNDKTDANNDNTHHFTTFCRKHGKTVVNRVVDPKQQCLFGTNKFMTFFLISYA